MMITDCVVGTEVRVVGSNLDQRHVFRMRELGLGPGTRAKVLQRAAFGGRVLAVLGQRIAVDGGTARSIQVELMTSDIAQETASTSVAPAQSSRSSLRQASALPSMPA